MRYLNGLEPAGLVGHFIAHPPENFSAFTTTAGIPVFLADFDLLTTADKGAKDFLARLPAATWLRRHLTWPTFFAGATVTEYLPLPEGTAASLVGELLNFWARRSRLLVLKDIPLASPLLPATERDAAAAFLAACRQRGFIPVEGQALAYVDIDFASADDYLSRLSPGRRKDIRRKLRSRGDIRIEVRETGHAQFRDPAFLAHLYALYKEVYAQSELHFDKLTAAFFAAVFQDASLDGRVFLYFHGEELIGFNLCFIHGGMLIDKFVGFRYPDARRHNLYFISWLENLEFARRHGLTHYVAGWTDPQIKAYLGAKFTFTQHAVYVRNPVLRFVLKRLSRHFESDRTWFDEHARKTVSPRP